MSESNPSESESTSPGARDRLDSWKEIAAYLKRDVTTVQRWEKRERMPVHRHVHDKLGSVWALRSELDAWTRGRVAYAPASSSEAGELQPVVPARAAASPVARRRGVWMAMTIVVAVTLCAAAVWWRLERTDLLWRNPVADAVFHRISDSEGTEPAAAVSRDGRFVAFLSDRDGRVDVWVTQVGTGRFYNLSRGMSAEFVNPSIRALGFSPDGALVTFWTRRSGGPAPAIGIWGVPVLGGEPRPYLEGAAELDWSPDASRLVYHTPGPGDPMFITDASRTPRNGSPVFTAAAGLHSHFPVWSPDQSFIYFVQGSLPDRMDIWRIRATGSAPEQITRHNGRVSHPVFLNARTLLYLASDGSGGGPWMYAIDVNKRIPHRISTGLETYTSLAGAPDAGHLVATLASTKSTLWRLSGNGRGVDAVPARVALTTASGMFPRLGPDYFLYVSSQDGGDSLWKQQGDVETTLWSSPGARILGAPAIDADGGRVAFVARQDQHISLYVLNADGTGLRAVDSSRQWQGTPSWAPDGRTIAAVALEGGIPRVFVASVTGDAPRQLSPEPAFDPVWSPDGRFILFSGPDVGTTFPLKRMATDGSATPFANVTLTRGSRHLRFLADGRTLVAMKGEIRHKNLFGLDLANGLERKLTDLPPDFEIRDFDISPDGREVILERAQTESRVVLLTLPRR